MPPRVEYELTERGEKLRGIIEQLQEWEMLFQTSAHDK
ncbi:winged helix-turn-helix transcriptional regulator [Paenibacillus sp. UMB4589-SE434]